MQIARSVGEKPISSAAENEGGYVMMPNALTNALVALIIIAALFLIFLAWWLLYCECRRWAAAAGLPAVLAIHSPMCPAGDGKELASLRVHWKVS